MKSRVTLTLLRQFCTPIAVVSCDPLFSKKKLSQHRICLEQGPANSLQTNGLAEQFNQLILAKI
jgi:hypothetical protein